MTDETSLERQITADSRIPVIHESEMKTEAYELGFHKVTDGPYNDQEDLDAILDTDDPMDYLWDQDQFVFEAGWELHRLAGYGLADDGGYSVERLVVFLPAGNELDDSPMPGFVRHPDDLYQLVERQFIRGLKMAAEHHYDEDKL